MRVFLPRFSDFLDSYWRMIHNVWLLILIDDSDTDNDRILGAPGFVGSLENWQEKRTDSRPYRPPRLSDYQRNRMRVAIVLRFHSWLSWNTKSGRKILAEVANFFCRDWCANAAWRRKQGPWRKCQNKSPRCRSTLRQNLNQNTRPTAIEAFDVWTELLGTTECGIIRRCSRNLR